MNKYSSIIVSVSTSNIHLNRFVLFTLSCIFFAGSNHGLEYQLHDFIQSSVYSFLDTGFLNLCQFCGYWHHDIRPYLSFENSSARCISIFSNLRYLPFKHMCSEIMVIGRYNSLRLVYSFKLSTFALWLWVLFT